MAVAGLEGDIKMPQMGLGGQAAISGLLQGLIGGYGQQRQRSLEQERKGVEDEMKNLTSVIRDYKDYQELEPGDPMRPLLEQKMTLAYGHVPGQQPTPPERRVRPVSHTPLGDLEEKFARPMMQSRLSGETALRGRPQMRADVLAGARERMAPAVTKPPTGLPSPGARLVKIYDTAKKRFGELNAELATLEFTQTEPRIILGKVLNQKTLDEEQENIAAKEKQVATVKARMDSTVAEGRRIYGESIVFEPPTQEPPAARVGLMSREEFIQAYINDPMNVQKMAPSEGIIEQAKGVDWQ